MRLDLDVLKLGLNDLLPIAQAWDGPADEFAESLEHVVFYLRSAEASGIKSPKAWLLKQLRAGYYGAPADFVSREGAQTEAKMRSRTAQAERRRQVRMQNLQAEFDLWLDTLDTPARQAIFAASGVADLAFVSPPHEIEHAAQPFCRAACRARICRGPGRGVMAPVLKNRRESP